jgi:hypothetical protein
VKAQSNAPTFTVKRAVKVIFPLEEQFCLCQTRFSPMLAREALGLRALLPYQPAAQVLNRIGGATSPVTPLWEQRQPVGEPWAGQAQQGSVAVERTGWEPPRSQPHGRRRVSMDGGMVQVRGEGWKELKVGVIGRV